MVESKLNFQNKNKIEKVLMKESNLFFVKRTLHQIGATTPRHDDTQSNDIWHSDTSCNDNPTKFIKQHLTSRHPAKYYAFVIMESF